jgi:hypothetical protein
LPQKPNLIFQTFTSQSSDP